MAIRIHPFPDRLAVRLELVLDGGRLPSGGDVKAPAEGSGPAIVTTNSRCTHRLADECLTPAKHLAAFA